MKDIEKLSDEEFEALLKEQFKSYEKEYDVVKEVLQEYRYIDLSCEALGGHTPESWGDAFMFCSHCGKTLEESDDKQ